MGMIKALQKEDASGTPAWNSAGACPSAPGRRYYSLFDVASEIHIPNSMPHGKPSVLLHCHAGCLDRRSNL